MVLMVALIKDSIKEKGVVKVPFFVFVSLVNAMSMRNLIKGTIQSDIFSQFMMFIFLSLIGYEVFRRKETHLDYRQIVNSPILNHTEYLFAVIKNEDLEIVTSNHAFKTYFENAKHFVDVPSLISRLHRGLSKIEIVDYKNTRHIFNVKMEKLTTRFSLLLLKEITDLEGLKGSLQELKFYSHEQWDNAPNMIMIRSKDGEIVYMNKQCEAFFEFPFEKFKGKSYKNLYIDKNEFYAHERHFASIDSEGTLKGVLKYTTPSEHMKFYDLVETITLYDNAKHILSSSVDITVKKHMELLIQSYVSMQKMDTENTVIFVLDFIFKDLLFIEKVNKTIGSNFTDLPQFMSGLNSQDQNKINKIKMNPEYFEPFSIQIQNGLHFFIEEVFIDKNGYCLGLMVKFLSQNQRDYSLNDIGSEVLQYVREGVLVIDYHGRIEYCNDYVLRILKYSRQEMDNMTILDITKGLTETMIQRNWLMSREHKTLQFERLYVTSEHEELAMDIFTIMTQHQGQEKLILLMTPSREKRLGYKLKNQAPEKSLRYAHIFDAFEHQVVEIKLPFKEVFFYDSFNEQEGFIGLELKFLQWLNNIHDLDRAQVFESVDTLVFDKAENFTFEYRYFTQGKWQWIRSKGRYVESEGKASIILLNSNIDDLKTAQALIEERKYIISEAEKIANIGYWRYDVQKNVFQVSEAFLEIFSLNLQNKSLPYEQFVENMLWTDRSYFEDSFYKFIWHGDQIDLVVRAQPKDKVIFYNFKGKIYKDEDGAPYYALGIIKDQTDSIKQKNHLTAQLQYHEQMINDAPIAMALVVKGGHLKFFNSRFKDQFEIEKNNVHDFESFISALKKDFKSFSNELLPGVEPPNTQITLSFDHEKLGKMTLLSSPLSNSENKHFGYLISVIYNGTHEKS